MIFRLEMCLYLLILLFFTSTKGQDITFNHLSEENGLSHNSVIAIGQDASGFMWYGTRYGLNRYDGRQFKIYQHHGGDSTSLPANIISAIYTDSRKTLWAGTTAGLCRYNPKKDCFERIPLTSGKPENVNDIFEDRTGRLWVAASSGLYLQTDSLFQFRKFTHEQGQLAGHTACCIWQDKQGNIWVGTSNGLNRLRETGGQFRFETFRHEESNPASLGMNYITSVAEDTIGRIWMGTQNAGIDIYDPVTHTFTHISQPALAHNFVRSIIRGKTGKMWVGTQEGVNVIDPVTLKATAYRHDPGNKNSISQNSIHSLFEDHSGTVWIGTYFGGVNMAPPHRTTFTTWQNSKGQSGISNDVVSNILEDGRQNLWICTEGGGLNYYNRKTGAYTYYKHMPGDAGSIGSNLVKVVYEDHDHNIWAGTHGGGLNVLAKGTGRFKRYFYNPQNPNAVPGEITSLMEDKEGRFWVGTSTGLHIMRREGTELFPLNDSALTGPAARQSIRYLFQDSRGRCWAGAVRGLYMSQGATMKPMLSQYINAVQEDSRGNIWVSLYYGGLVRYSPDLRQHTLYTEKDGLPHSNVMGLLEDEQHQFWISTGNGLTRFNPRKKTFRTFTASDGLAGNTFNYNAFLKDSRGELYFGGFNGITSFFPDRIATNTYCAPLLFTGLQLFKDPVGINEENGLLKEDIGYTRKLSFRHDQEVFTIEFALLNYIKSGKNRYACKLEGAGGDWIETGSPSVTYANLPSGSYRLWVKGANNDGVWSAPVYMDIIVRPPFWRSWWAWCLYAALGALLLFAIIRYFFMQALLLKKEGPPREKLSFISHIVHEIRTHLALMMVPMEKMREKYGRQVQSRPPAVPAAGLPGSPDNAFLEKLVQLVYEHMDDPEFGVDMLARKVAMSQPVLYKKLKALTNMSVNDFVKSLRLSKAAELIRKKEHAVYEVAYMVGYNDRKYFSREFKKQFGKTPTAYADGEGL